MLVAVRIFLTSGLGSGSMVDGIGGLFFADYVLSMGERPVINPPVTR